MGIIVAFITIQVYVSHHEVRSSVTVVDLVEPDEVGILGDWRRAHHHQWPCSPNLRYVFAASPQHATLTLASLCQVCQNGWQKSCSDPEQESQLCSFAIFKKVYKKNLFCAGDKHLYSFVASHMFSCNLGVSVADLEIQKGGFSRWRAKRACKFLGCHAHFQSRWKSKLNISKQL